MTPSEPPHDPSREVPGPPSGNAPGAPPSGGSAPRLRPREHGAYAMLAFPLVSGLLHGGFTLPGVAFGLLTVAGFLGHESVLILRGARGERVRTGAADAARRRLTGLGVVALGAGLVFLGTAPVGAWRAALLTTVLVLGVTALLWRGWSKTLPGEVVAAAAFSSVHAVLAASGGAGLPSAFAVAGLWATSFVLATLGVHALKYRFKGRGPGRWTLLAAPLLAVAVLAGAGAGLLLADPRVWLPALLVPKAGMALFVSLRDVHPRNLKRLGWSLVAADLVALVGVGVWVA